MSIPQYAADNIAFQHCTTSWEKRWIHNNHSTSTHLGPASLVHLQSHSPTQPLSSGFASTTAGTSTSVTDPNKRLYFVS
ncbi:hypothetical protein PILCRDRAFT_629966 [Piloderma croceum F 1598]|uniref:Uncharacterized protein n=1 Tax=Piloderma croceum (strain F 1598) TaxID=765440 RepID=A0A0C3FAT5_PILCF|nr:hypothetical protein PILCRDRAFT_629966 [Piloderma croceum F 1598]